MDSYFIYFPELQTICVDNFPSLLAQHKTTASIVRPSVKVLCQQHRGPRKLSKLCTAQVESSNVPFWHHGVNSAVASGM